MLITKRVTICDNYKRVHVEGDSTDIIPRDNNLVFELDFVTRRITGANFAAPAIFSSADPTLAFVSLLETLFGINAGHDISDFIESLIKTNTNDGSLQFTIIDATECCLIILLHLIYFKKYTNQNIWVLVDLPPGVGKTFEICRLFDVLAGNIAISTPTAKAATLFPHRLHVKTLHSRFNLPIRHSKQLRAEIQASVNKYFEKPNTPDLYIFDEFSMYDAQYILPLFKELYFNNKTCIIVGDSCQMPPVRAALIDWRELLCQKVGVKVSYVVPKITQNPTDDRIDMDESIKIKRLEHGTCSGGDCLVCIRRQKLYEFILFLRRHITQSREKALSYKLTVDSLKYFASFFETTQVEAELSLEKIIQDIVFVQNKVLDGLWEGLKQTPCVIGYENKINFTVLDQIKEHCKFDTASNILADAESNIENIMVPNIIVQSDIWTTNSALVYRSLQLDLSNTVATLSLSKGMFIKCKENDSKSKTYNGQLAIFLGFVVTNECKPNVRRVHDLIGKCDYKIGFIKDAICSIKMKIYDLTSGEEKLLNPVQKICCENCRQKTCLTHLAVPCKYFVFNWCINYSNTIFGLQGATIVDEKIYLLSELVLKSNIIRTAYIIFSRVKDPAQLTLNGTFIKKLLVHIFGCTENQLLKFLKQTNLKLF